MPRPLRYTIPGVPQHIVQRGNDRRATFFSNDDRHFYLACLHRAAQQHRLAVHAYVLMTNHVHLLATPASPDAIAKTLQSVGRRYVQFVNVKRERSGTLWEGRHRASIVQSERYFAMCHAYIELNPVRAGIVREPLAYEWSSCRHYAGAANDPLISDSPTFIASASRLEDRRAIHRELLAAGIAADRLDDIRTQTARGGVIGDAGYRDEIAARLARRVPSRPRGRPRLEDGGKHSGAAEVDASVADLFGSDN